MSPLDTVVQKEVLYVGDYEGPGPYLTVRIDDEDIGCFPRDGRFGEHDWVLTTFDSELHGRGLWYCRRCRRTEIIVVRKGTYAQD